MDDITNHDGEDAGVPVPSNIVEPVVPAAFADQPEADDALPVPRGRHPRGEAARAAVVVVAGLVLVAAIGGTGFVIGHYVGRGSSPSVIGAFPRNQSPELPSDGFGNLPANGSNTFPVTPPTPPANAPSTSAAAKIAAKVDASVVDISTVSSYQASSAAGTGMILSADGLVLTNNHVINGATSIRVRVVATNRTYAATVLGYSVTKDVALLQLTNASGLTPVAIANSRAVTKSEGVVGIGNAGGVGGAPSYAPGAVVATNQSLTASDPSNLTGVERLSGMIQVVADIQPGDSGGPLVNTRGQVIGMDTAGSTTGLGFGFGDGSNTSATTEGYAIPIKAALAVVRTIEQGTSTAAVHVGPTPILGVEINSTFSGFGGFNTPTASGVQIAGLAAGSPAASSGLVAGDIITAVDGHAVANPSQLSRAVQKFAVGTTVQVSYVNAAGATATVSVTLTSGPAL